MFEKKCHSYCCKSQYKQKFYNILNKNIIVFELESIYEETQLKNLTITLEKSLLYYNAKKIINCPLCRGKNFEVKKYTYSLPKIFIFVMNKGKNAKFNCKIKINKELEMNKYYTQVDMKYADVHTKYDFICVTFVNDWKTDYRHVGHIIAFCKNYNDKNFYDTKVIEADINEIDGLKNIPYILFYEKRLKNI